MDLGIGQTTEQYWFGLNKGVMIYAAGLQVVELRACEYLKFVKEIEDSST